MREEGSEEELDEVAIPDELPVLPIRDLVVFPYMIVPLFVSRPLSQAAIDAALARDKLLFLVAQRDAAEDDPGLDALHPVGTIGMVIRQRRLSDGRTKVLVQGLVKARLESLVRVGDGLAGRVSRIDEPELPAPGLEVEALGRNVREQLSALAASGRPISSDVLLVLAQIADPGRLADLSAANIGLKVDDAQALLSIVDPVERLVAVNEHLARETELAAVQKRIESQARQEITRTQREYYLRQQLRQIQRELGQTSAAADELHDLEERLARAMLPAHAEEEANRQLRRLGQMPPDAAESAVLRTWLEWVADLPWHVTSEDTLDLARARAVLDEDHDGLEPVKERILDFLGVLKLKRDTKGPLLCFTGPPGVGKTSLGRAIAKALGRSFVRVSLGGVRDEAEIRGHRRTYVGAMPGRIVQALRQAKTRNPVLVLDELDKLGTGEFRGDPCAALLEVLDAEQNHAFRDHYLNVEFDLSQVLFIATANHLDDVPAPLRDRLEVLQLPGYSEDEKVRIARRHVVPRQLAEHGLASGQLAFTDAALRRLVRDHTREAGLRHLERQVATVCRKVARAVAEGVPVPPTITPRDVARHLGPAKYLRETEMSADAIGEATGLAWTPAGGELLRIEASAMRGPPGLILTGQLGEVMRESARAALTWVRSQADALGVDARFFEEHELHVHVPAGAVPKDGPSAGVTIAAALASLVTGRAVRRDVAATGEVTLRGRLLAVGGVKEKVLAAARAGLEAVVLPTENVRDLATLPASVRRRVQVIPASTLDEVLAAMLVPDKRRAKLRRVRVGARRIRR